MAQQQGAGGERESEAEQRLAEAPQRKARGPGQQDRAGEAADGRRGGSEPGRSRAKTPISVRAMAETKTSRTARPGSIADSRLRSAARPAIAGAWAPNGATGSSGSADSGMPSRQTSSRALVVWKAMPGPGACQKRAAGARSASVTPRTASEGRLASHGGGRPGRGGGSGAGGGVQPGGGGTSCFGRARSSASRANATKGRQQEALARQAREGRPPGRKRPEGERQGRHRGPGRTHDEKARQQHQEQQRDEGPAHGRHPAVDSSGQRLRGASNRPVSGYDRRLHDGPRWPARRALRLGRDARRLRREELPLLREGLLRARHRLRPRDLRAHLLARLVPHLPTRSACPARRGPMPTRAGSRPTTPSRASSSRERARPSNAWPSVGWCRAWSRAAIRRAFGVSWPRSASSASSAPSSAGARPRSASLTRSRCSSALERLAVEPRQAAYVGDSPEDVQMAKSAGAFAVGIPGGFPNGPALAAAEPHVLSASLEAAVSALLR